MDLNKYYRWTRDVAIEGEVHRHGSVVKGDDIPYGTLVSAVSVGWLEPLADDDPAAKPKKPAAKAEAAPVKKQATRKAKSAE